jgi:SAM-dependent methyltransferase
MTKTQSDENTVNKVLVKSVPEYIDTVHCRVCSRTDRVEFLKFPDMPLANALVAESELAEDERRFPLTVLFCPDCSLVQIRETVNPEILFASDYPFFSSVSDAWLLHARANALELTDRLQLGSSSLVVEIASNDGYLLRNYVERGIPVLGIEPASGPAAAARQLGIPVREEFFDQAVAQALADEGLSADVIHANNVLAHVADLSGVLDGIRILLRERGTAVIEVPYVRDLIERCEFDTIYHEHLCYFSVTALVRLFSEHGLTLVDVRPLPTYGGSLRLYVQRTGSPSTAVLQLLQEEEQAGLRRVGYYEDFASRVEKVQHTLRELLESLKNRGMRIAGYGVAAKATVLLNSAGISRPLLDYMVDRSAHKQGKYVPGLQLPIYPPRKLLDQPRPDYVLLLAWNLKDEIMRQQQEYRASGGKFIVPIPQPMIVDDAA